MTALQSCVPKMSDVLRDPSNDGYAVWYSQKYCSRLEAKWGPFVTDQSGICSEFHYLKRLKYLGVHRKPVWVFIKHKLPSWEPTNSMTSVFVSRNHWLHGPLPPCTDRDSTTLSASFLANLSSLHLFHVKCYVKTVLGNISHGEMKLVRVKPLIRAVKVKSSLI